MLVPDPEKISILGVQIHRLSQQEMLKRTEKILRSQIPHCHQIVTVNPEFIVTAQKDKKFKQILNQASLSLADGTGIIWASKKIGEKLPEKIPGIDFVEKLARLQKYSFFLLGGAPGTAKKAANKLLKKYPRLRILNAISGGKITETNLNHQKKIVAKINRLKPDILLVALGAPKQDKFIYHWQNKLNCKVAIGVGGTFDYWAGNVSRAPKFLRKIGLEWLWRLLLEPKRYKRIFTALIIFPLYVIFKTKKT